MKKVLITGGSGSIGKAFIKKYYDLYEFYNISRGEKLQAELKDEFPLVTNYTASIEDECALYSVYDKVKPDIVIHTAAMKHIEVIEQHPIQGCKINILGSLNVISASRWFHVPMTINISTDKACRSKSVYGNAKFLVEKCFMEANTDRNKFISCRFANVANSSSSIIPRWKKMKEDGVPLRVTDKKMNRMMFSLEDSALFIYKSIGMCDLHGGGWIGVKGDMKTVNIYELAKSISDDVEIIGVRSHVEKFEEDLISERELPFTTILDWDFFIVSNKKNDNNNRLTEPYGSLNTQKMTEEEIKEMIEGE